MQNQKKCVSVPDIERDVCTAHVAFRACISKATLVFLMASTVISAFSYAQNYKNVNEATLLAPATDVTEACRRKFRESSIVCSIDGSEPVPLDPFLGGLSMTYGEMARRGLGEHEKVVSTLRLSTHQTPSGFIYFTATPELFISNSLNGTLRPTNEFNDIFWAAVAFSVKVAPSESDAAREYIAESEKSIQEEISRVKAQNELEAAARQNTQRRAAYEASDKCKASVAKDRIEQCEHMKKAAKGTMERQKRIAEIGGVYDKSVQYNAAQTIVFCEDEEQRQWMEYKKRGGDAPTIKALLKR